MEYSKVFLTFEISNDCLTKKEKIMLLGIIILIALGLLGSAVSSGEGVDWTNRGGRNF